MGQSSEEAWPKIEHNNCDGCIIKQKESSCAPKNSNGSCPCTNCLVKVTCVDEQGDCSLYDCWYRKEGFEDDEKKHSH